MQVSSGFFRWFSSRPNDLRDNSDKQSRVSTFVGQSVEGSHRRRGLGRSSSSGAPPPPPAPPLPPPCPCSPARICHSSSQALVQNCDTQIHLLAHSEAKMKVDFFATPPSPPPPSCSCSASSSSSASSGCSCAHRSRRGGRCRPARRQRRSSSRPLDPTLAITEMSEMIIEVWQKCLL